MSSMPVAAMRRALPTVSNRICRPSISQLSAPFSSIVTVGHKYYSSSIPPTHRVHVGEGMASPNTVGLPRDTEVGNKRFADFDLKGRTFIVTGGAQGLGLATAEGLVEAGARVYCLDRAPRPGEYWDQARRRVVPEWGGSLAYRQVDVTDTPNLQTVIDEIARENQGLHGAIAAAGIQQVTPALDYKVEDARRMMETNYTAVLMTATATARNMFKYRCHGSICLIASMSGSVANKGLLCSVYNSSKAAVIQLARNLAMEWGRLREDGTGGIRVNCLSPGHIVTPMVVKNFEENPELKDLWCRENMVGRLSTTAEFKGAALFLVSNASSFMTGANLVVDGGHTAW